MFIRDKYTKQTFKYIYVNYIHMESFKSQKSPSSKLSSRFRHTWGRITSAHQISKSISPLVEQGIFDHLNSFGYSNDLFVPKKTIIIPFIKEKMDELLVWHTVSSSLEADIPISLLQLLEPRDIMTFNAISQLMRNIHENPDNPVIVQPLYDAIAEFINVTLTNEQKMAHILLVLMLDAAYLHNPYSELALLDMNESELKSFNRLRSMLDISLFSPLAEYLSYNVRPVLDNAIANIFPDHFREIFNKLNEIRNDIFNSKKVLDYLVPKIREYFGTNTIYTVEDVNTRDSKSISSLVIKMVKKGWDPTAKINIKEINDLVAGMFVVDENISDLGLRDLGSKLMVYLNKELQDSEVKRRFGIKYVEVSYKINPKYSEADFEALHINLHFPNSNLANIELLIMDRHAKYEYYFGNFAHSIYASKRFGEAVDTISKNSEGDTFSRNMVDIAKTVPHILRDGLGNRK